jgi:hypothetical protein
MSLEAGYGYTGAIEPYYKGFKSNFSGMNHFNVGIRYMFTEKIGAKVSYKFDHCILKTLRNTSNVHYSTIYSNNPGYRDISVNDYRLTSTSFAIDKGDTGIFIPFDLNNAARPNPSTSLPDLGAYEFY